MIQQRSAIKCICAFNITWLLATPVQAQPVPDVSLGTEHSIIIPNQTINGVPSEIISGGAFRQSNLFHSLQDFSVEEGRGVYFQNPPGITNILTRITGGDSSQILGTLGVLGSANLFLINPNGILFGPNAQLDLAGSFLASTANSIDFTDGSKFSATNPATVPQLVIRVPSGLNFTGSSATVEIQGTGNTLSLPPGQDNAPLIGAGESPNGLRVLPGKTLGLVGGDVSFNAGVATAPSGRIEVGSVVTGRVAIDLSGKRFDYSGVQAFQDIQLKNLSLLDASGPFNGNISLTGKNISLTDASSIYMRSLAGTPGAAIDINASGSLLVRGATMNPIVAPISIIPGTNISPVKIRSGIATQSFTGQGAAINISATDVALESAGGIVSAAFISGKGGDVGINASNSVRVIGTSPIDPLSNFSGIITSAATDSNSGNININTENVVVQGGGAISSGNFSTGLGGNIAVNALSSVLIDGTSLVFTPSLVATSTYRSGRAGDLGVHTKQLSVLNGASLSTGTDASGPAGDLTVDALKSVRVSGFVEPKGIPGIAPGTRYPSLITSSALVLPILLQQKFGIPPAPSGASANVKITTEQMVVDNLGQISVRNDGTGPAGTLEIIGNSANLNNGSLVASTVSGNGGNIQLNIKDLLLLRNNSNIAASASGTGNGGNIIIDPDLVVLLEDSRISADAQQGLGGRVDITAKGLFYPPGSITARSALGPQFNGTVQVNTPDTDFAKATTLTAPPQQAPEITSVCQRGSGSTPGQFVKVGTGGIPPKPGDLLHSSAGWQDQPPRSTAAAVQAAVLDDPDDPDVQGVIFHPDGTLNFITQPGVFYSPSSTLPCKSSTVKK